jgi:hypothetical protein
MISPSTSAKNTASAMERIEAVKRIALILAFLQLVE